MPSEPPTRRILLGIGGGVAAYKAMELVRLLRRAGVEITPVPTANARRFVTPTALQAVAGRRPRLDLWDAGAEAAMGHIELARWADAVVVAPATANLIARLANGLADDLLATLCLATTAPLFLAPAMNVRMWRHPATQRNVARLAADGAAILGPADGEQACGETGPGRMLEPAAIVDAVLPRLAASAPLTGVRVLVTAGPTREFLDPVRFISNRSSGRQGFALAQAAQRAGGDVSLVAGPVQLPTPAGVARIDVVSAQEMKRAVAERVSAVDMFICAAAVADYRPSRYHPQKLKKRQRESAGADGEAGAGTAEGGGGQGEISVPLRENDDIVASVAGACPRPYVVGFAAETENVLAHARAKRVRKGMDAIVVNDVADGAIGFDSVDNAVTLIHAGGEVALPKAPKAAIAERLIAALATLYAAAERAA